MKRFFFLLSVIAVGFSVNDVRDESILLQWHKIEASEAPGGNRLGVTFPDAVYPDVASGIPVFARSYTLPASNRGWRFVIEDPVLEAMETPAGFSDMEEIPEKLEITQKRFKAGETYKVDVLLPAVVRRDGKLFLLKEFALKQIPVRQKAATVDLNEWKGRSVLQNGQWYKIRTSGEGIYKISYSTLEEWGVSSPAEVKVFGAGGMLLAEDPGDITYDDLPQVAVWHGENRGESCLFFYAPGTAEWFPGQNGETFEHVLNPYSGEGYFFITEDSGPVKAIENLEAPEGAVTHSISTFDAYDLYETEEYNLLQSGKQYFSDRFIRGGTKNVSFDLSGADASGTVSVEVKAAARSSLSSQMTVFANQSRLGTLDFSSVNTSDATSRYADLRESEFSLSDLSPGSLDLSLEYSGSSSNASAWLDFIRINYRAKIKLENDALFFRDIASLGDGNVLEFSIETGSSKVKVWDVTDVFNVKAVPLSFEGNVAKGRVGAGALREFAAFDSDGAFPEPEWVGKVENQNLHALDTPEFLIISHPLFLSAANALADFHRSNDGMSVEVVSSEKVYNEFSSGRKSATGIRNFIKMFYDRAQGLKYVLLFGDGSYDNRGTGTAHTGFIPTFQSENSLNPVASFVSDDYFVILDAGESVYDGAVDLGVGRIPVSTAYQAGLVVEKIRDYYAADALGEWRNTLCFIADDEDGNLHMSDSEKLTDLLNENHRALITDKIYFDAFEQVAGPGGERYPGVTEAINERVKDGVLLINYMGHANERFLADEKVLDVSHINSWTNAGKLPVFVTATCEFSRFDADETSAGEYILLNPNGGGIGLFSTTRLVFAYSNFLLSRNFYRYVFEKNENGGILRMGDIMRLAKVNTINTVNKRSFSLLADPALRLTVPQHRVITATINGRDVSIQQDTLGALQQVTVSGYIADASGDKLENFSGEIIPTVFDKAMYTKTLGNGGEAPMDFKVQENIIYKGNAAVTNGEFSFSFVVPKDISYQLGQGKIIYYATNGETDANGAFEDFYIGGTGDQISDNQGPEIELYLDSPDFEPGDQVSKNPTLLAKISDESGINTVGTGIGHDITAVIDDDYSNVLVLNDFYSALPGETASGMVRYPLRNLSPGQHTLRLKAWDVANNSTEAEIEFEVSGAFVISEVNNYPNPVNGYTYFTFEHNQGAGTLEALFEVFDPYGRKVDAFSAQVASSDQLTSPVRWDLDERGVKPEQGIYIYRISAQNEAGVIASRSGKMLIFY